MNREISPPVVESSGIDFVEVTGIAMDGASSTGTGSMRIPMSMLFGCQMASGDNPLNQDRDSSTICEADSTVYESDNLHRPVYETDNVHHPVYESDNLRHSVYESELSDNIHRSVYESDTVPFKQTMNWNNVISPSEAMIHDRRAIDHGLLNTGVMEESPMCTETINKLIMSDDLTEASVFMDTMSGQKTDASNQLIGASSQMSSFTESDAFPTPSVSDSPDKYHLYLDPSVIQVGSGGMSMVSLVPSGEVGPHGELTYILVYPENDPLLTPKNVSNTEAVEAPMLTNFVVKKVEEQPLKCPLCDFKSFKKNLIHKHMKSHNDSRPYKCTQCDHASKNVASFKNHCNMHNGVRPWQCDFCTSSFTTSGELVRHKRYRHTFEKPHKCPQCDYSCVEMSKLKRHIRAHNDDRPFKCTQCTYASSDQYKLTRHSRVHSGDKPHACQLCPRRFTQNTGLKHHMLTIHSESESPRHKCPICPSTVARKCDLRSHMDKLHTKRPVPCKKCDLTLPDRYTYKLHIREHTKVESRDIPCKDCSYVAYSPRDLNSHSLTHNDKIVYPCDRCDQSFNNKNLLRSHIARSHCAAVCGCDQHADADANCENCAKSSMMYRIQSEFYPSRLADCGIEGYKAPEVTIVHPTGFFEQVHPPTFTHQPVIQTDTRTDIPAETLADDHANILQNTDSQLACKRIHIQTKTVTETVTDTHNLMILDIAARRGSEQMTFDGDIPIDDVDDIQSDPEVETDDKMSDDHIIIDSSTQMYTVQSDNEIVKNDDVNLYSNVDIIQSENEIEISHRNRNESNDDINIYSNVDIIQSENEIEINKNDDINIYSNVDIIPSENELDIHHKNEYEKINTNVYITESEGELEIDVETI